MEYKNKHSAINAIRELNGKMLKEHRLHLDYGTIKAARCLLINGISKSISEQSLVGCVNRSLSNAKIGRVRSCLMDEIKGSALLFFECVIITFFKNIFRYTLTSKKCVCIYILIKLIYYFIIFKNNTLKIE